MSQPARKPAKFKIPLQIEVQMYMMEKKGWPESFCIYYATKFWNNYQAAGWKLSNGNLMKDWHAAFNAQWQNVKYADDLEKFKQCGGKAEPAKIIHMTNPEKTGWVKPESDIEKLDDLLIRYTKGLPPISQQELSTFAKSITVNSLWPQSITKEQMDKIKLQFYNDPIRVKAYFVERTLVYYISFGITFSGAINSKKSSNA